MKHTRVSVRHTRVSVRHTRVSVMHTRVSVKHTRGAQRVPATLDEALILGHSAKCLKVVRALKVVKFLNAG